MFCYMNKEVTYEVVELDVDRVFCGVYHFEGV